MILHLSRQRGRPSSPVTRLSAATTTKFLARFTAIVVAAASPPGTQVSRTRTAEKASADKRPPVMNSGFAVAWDGTANPAQDLVTIAYASAPGARRLPRGGTPRIHHDEAFSRRRSHLAGSAQASDLQYTEICRAPVNCHCGRVASNVGGFSTAAGRRAPEDDQDPRAVRAACHAAHRCDRGFLAGRMAVLVRCSSAPR